MSGSNISSNPLRIKKREISNLSIILALVAILIYVIIRLVTYFLYSRQFMDRFFTTLLLGAELFLLIHTFGYALNLLMVIVRKKTTQTADVPLPLEPENQPSVALLVAARHEPKEVLENTFLRLKAVDYHNKMIYFLDDSSDETFKNEADELAQRMGITLFRRVVRRGAKAGIVNDCLKTRLTEDFVAIFDADQSPMPGFLKTLVPFFVREEKLAFVQTPQFYSNMNECRIAAGAAFQQAVFYEYICEGKSTNDAMFCCGTNVLFRRRALLEVGGFDETTVTEDFATSVKLHSRGWRSHYYPHVSVFGMGPVDLSGYFKQQYRWAIGTLSVLKRLIRQFINHPLSLSPIQWWEYFLSSSYYLVGIAFFILMACPIVYIFFNVPSFMGRQEIYLGAFIPYSVLSISVFYSILSRRQYRFRDLILGQFLGFISFPVYFQAAMAAFLGIKTEFGITEKGRSRAVSYWKLWPNLVAILLNFSAMVWAMNRFIYERDVALLVNGFWVSYHSILLGSLFFFNEEPARLGCPVLRQDAQMDYKIVSSYDSYSELDRATWRRRLTAHLDQNLKSGMLILSKVKLENETPVLFQGRVLWSDPKKNKLGFLTDLGITTIAEEDWSRLEKWIQNDTKRKTDSGTR